MEYSNTAVSGLIDIITNPTKALLAADQKPRRMWLPFILAILISTVLSIYYFSVVDMDWMFQQLQTATEAKGQELPDEMREFFSSSTLMAAAIGGSIVMVVLTNLITAFYLLMVAKFSTEDQRTFGKWFSLSVWTSFPITLSMVLMMLYFAVLGSSQIGFEDLSFFSINALVMHYPSGSTEAAFYSQITPFLFWVIGLLAMGLKLWTERTIGKSLIISAVPFVVIYGLWGFASL